MNEQMSVRAGFKTRAVIDWIDLTVTLERKTQFPYVQKKLQATIGTDSTPYVNPVNAGAGGASNRFTIRLHDHHANDLGELERITDKLALAHSPEVAGIELALDFYPKHDPDDIPPLVLRLQRSIEAYGNPRQFDPDKAPTPKHGNRFLNPDRPEPVTGLILDPRLNLRIGDKGDPVSLQIYDKRTDNNRQPIAPDQRRARAEFTLIGSELASRALGPNAGSRLVTLDDLRTFKFETLANLLHFRQFRPIDQITGDPFIASALANVTKPDHGITNHHIGMRSFYQDKRWPNGKRKEATRKHSDQTIADAELNDIVRRKLAYLTKRFR